MSERKIETESLTKGCYHLALAREYVADFKRTCNLAAKRQAGLWEGKLNFVISDVRSALTPAARERFDEEIIVGDVMFPEAIAERWIRLNPEQRNLLETMCDAMIRGEEIVITQ